MSPATWRSVRWLVVLALAALIVVITVPMAFNAILHSVEFGGELEAGDDDDETQDPGVGEVPAGPVEDGTATAQADFAVRDGTVRQSTAEQLSLEDDGDAIVLAFPLIDGNPECVATAQLQVEVLDAQPTELHVYASDVANPAEVEDGDEVGDPRRDDERRSTAVSDGSSGRLVWDVTELYQAWALGDLAPPGSRLTVVIRPPEPVSIRMAAAEGDDDEAPTLAWEGVPDCE